MLLILLGALAIGLVGGGRARSFAGRRNSEARLWARDLAVGVLAGLMIATKETAWLMILSSAVALVLTPEPRRWLRRHGGIVAGPALLAFVVAAIVLGGPGMLLAPLGFYPGLAASGGDHAHPWFYYLGFLLWSRPQTGGPVWSEAAIMVLACLGGWVGWRRSLPRFLAVYTVLLAAAYALIPYKTPWCLLGFWWGAAVLAGIGAAGVWIRIKEERARWGWAVVLVAAAVHLGWQAWRASFVFPADRRNPYVYAQAVGDVVRLGALVGRLARAHPDGNRMLVAVIGPDPWPLPWYLRRMPRVGYWPEPDADARRAVRAAPVVIAGRGLVRPPAGRVVRYYGLRPDVTLEVSVERRLWERAVR